MSQKTEINESIKPLTDEFKNKEQILISKLIFNEKQSLDIRSYKKRWIAVGLFLLSAAPSTCQWIQYAIISNITSRYYNVSSISVDMTSIIFMAYYVILIFPATYLMDRVGLRWTVILGSAITCIGSWIKIFSTSRDRFWVTFIGHSLVASVQVLILNVPGRLAAFWFSSRQVSTATSLCLFGTQMGIAIGFLASPMAVSNHEDVNLIGDDFDLLFKSVALITTFSTAMVVLFFKEEPTLPPSKTRAMQKLNRQEEKESFVKPIGRLLRNKSFLILCNSYGIGVGVFNVIATLLNQMVLLHFENGEKDAGQVGLALTAMGLLGAVVFGFVIDKTRKYKETAVIVYLLTFFAQIFFSVAMMSEIKWMIYTSGMCLGFFLAGYLALGYELCVEYTYPEPEDISTGLLNILNNIYGIIFVLGLGKVIDIYGDLFAHVALCSLLFLGLILTLITKDEQRRQKIICENRAASMLALSKI